jgi:hypothetical protein
MTSYSARLGAVVLTLCVARGVLGAQQCSSTPASPSRTEWFPRGVSKSESSPPSAADRATIAATLTAVEALVRNTVLGTPRGYEIQPWWVYDTPVSRSRLSQYYLRVSLWCPSRASGTEPSPTLEITFNPDPVRWSEGDRPMLDEKGDGLYFERVRTATRFGAVATYGDFDENKRIDTQGLFVLFTAGGESPTLPVSREEYLRAMIFTLEGKDQETVKKLATEKTPYQLWLEGTAQRKKDREQLYATLVAIDPAQAAQVRKDLEKVEVETAANFKKDEALDRELRSQGLANLTGAGDRFYPQIADMTPRERASAAWVIGTHELVPAGTPNANAVVRANPAFYRARRSPVEPRAVLVRVQAPYVALMAVHQQMYRQLDWAALKRMVEERR